jgi:hypothetical protein
MIRPFIINEIVLNIALPEFQPAGQAPEISIHLPVLSPEIGIAALEDRPDMLLITAPGLDLDVNYPHADLVFKKKIII